MHAGLTTVYYAGNHREQPCWRAARLPWRHQQRPRTFMINSAPPSLSMSDQRMPLLPPSTTHASRMVVVVEKMRQERALQSPQW